MADVVLPGLGELVRGRGHRHEQRAAGAARAQGARPARAARATTSRSSATSPAGSATTGSTPTAEDASGTSCASLSPMHAGMSYARLEELGGIQWPCHDEDDPGAPFLHGRLWESPIARPAGAVLRLVEHELPVDRLTDEFPHPADHRAAARLVQHGRPDGRLHVAAAAAARRSTSRRRTAEQLGVAGGRARPDLVAARDGRRAGAGRPGAAPRPGVHDAALPRRGADATSSRSRPPTRSRAPPSSRRARSGSRSCPCRQSEAAPGRVALPAR